MFKSFFEESIGKRVRCIGMYDDPNPIEPNTMGTIYHYGGGVLNVEWDNGRKRGLVVGMDKFEILNETKEPNHLVLKTEVS